MVFKSFLASNNLVHSTLSGTEVLCTAEDAGMWAKPHPSMLVLLTIVLNDSIMVPYTYLFFCGYFRIPHYRENPVIARQAMFPRKPVSH